MSLGTKLRQLRTERNLSQAQVALELDVSQTAYGKWESDQTKPAMDNLMKIAGFYDTDVYSLLDEKSIIQNNTDKAIGSIQGTVTINHTISEDLINSIIKNQQDITRLVEAQGTLIEKLLKK